MLLLDAVDDGAAGPGPHASNPDIPDVGGVIYIQLNAVGCNTSAEILARAHVAELPSGDFGKLSFVSSDAGCALAGSPNYINANTLSPAPPTNLTFADGAMEFTVNGCTAGASVEVSMDYGQDLAAAGTTYWKSGSPWQMIPSSVNGSVITYTLIDGGTGDEDGSANGVIVDPGGAALMSALLGGTLAVPVNSPWLLLMLALGLGGLSRTVAKRHKKTL